MSFQIFLKTYPLKNPFAIAHGTVSQVGVLEVHLQYQNIIGKGECRPYARYGETLETVKAQIEQTIPEILSCFPDFQQAKTHLQTVLPAGAARNALDCALWHLLCQQQGKTIFDLIQAEKHESLPTLYTIPIDTPDMMAENALRSVQKGAKILKIKLGSQANIERLKALRESCPTIPMMLDMNESWTEDFFIQMIPILEHYQILFIEQPLPVGQEPLLSPTNIPLFADESCHDVRDLEQLSPFYQGINIKLDKTGGLTHALLLFQYAKHKKLKIMIGCMMASSLSIAPAYALACLGADYYDLDAPALLRTDQNHAMIYQAGFIYAPTADLWG